MQQKEKIKQLEELVRQLKNYEKEESELLQNEIERLREALKNAQTEKELECSRTANYKKEQTNLVKRNSELEERARTLETQIASYA